MNMKKQYNIARGKPSSNQLDLSNEMLSDLDGNYISEEGLDIRNYGGPLGLIELRRLFADLLDTTYEHVVVQGNSSLNIMFNIICKNYVKGVDGNTPWCKLDKIKWLCPVPGYDRHFKILEYFNIEMINVPLKDDGPDMDMVEELIKNPEVKGIWCIPKYNNPTGTVYSDEVINRLARLKPAAKDFRIYYDNAYFIHDLYDEIKIPDIISLCEKYNNTDLVYEFASTSKITFAGQGVSALISSPKNLKEYMDAVSVQIINHDKINQFRHYRFLKDAESVRKLMKKHADILRPKFEMVDKILSNNLKDKCHWTKPKGGYFVTLYVDNLAKEVVQECKNRGLVLTDAGCAHPYHKDDSNSVIRIAPSYLELEELKEALTILCRVINELIK